MSESYLERIASALIKDAGLPDPIREFRFCEGRRWRCDFVWVFDPAENKKHKGLILEINGSIWTKGKHTYGKQLLNEYEKLNQASLDGWIIIQVGKLHMLNGQMIQWVKQGLGILNADE